MSADELTADEPTTVPPRGAVSAVDRFTASHGGVARAVVQPVSRGQVRLVLVGSDGTLGDVMVPDVATAEAVVAASSATVAEWDRELAGSVRLSRERRLRMAGKR